MLSCFRRYSIEKELQQSKYEVIVLNHQLMEAIHQKNKVSSLLDQWQVRTMSCDVGQDYVTFFAHSVSFSFVLLLPVGKTAYTLNGDEVLI